MADQMPPLAEIGEALFGSRWQSDLARALGVTDRTVRRWTADGAVPEKAMAQIWALAMERSRRAAEVAAAIEDAGAILS